MIPANARPAHRRLRQKLAEIAGVERTTVRSTGSSRRNQLGIITSGISFMHAREAAPKASVLKLGSPIRCH
jgi:indolepyruvate ferredoxin oxidoreductase, alpha subunit